MTRGYIEMNVSYMCKPEICYNLFAQNVAIISFYLCQRLETAKRPKDCVKTLTPFLLKTISSLYCFTAHVQEKARLFGTIHNALTEKCCCAINPRL